MNWKDAKAAIEHKLSLTLESCEGGLSVVRRLQSVLLNEEGTLQERVKLSKRDLQAIETLNDEESFRKYCTDRAEWDPLYAIGVDTPSDTK